MKIAAEFISAEAEALPEKPKLLAGEPGGLPAMASAMARWTFAIRGMVTSEFPHRPHSATSTP
jgi:hypothetical protein